MQHSMKGPRMTPKIASVLVVAALVGVGAAAAARSSVGDSTAPATTSTTAIEVPTVLDDWCSSMRLAFGGSASVPTVKVAYQRSISGGAATPEVAYVALLEGIPDAIAQQYAILRTAGQALVGGSPVGDSIQILAAASAVDTFIGSNCGA